MPCTTVFTLNALPGERILPPPPVLPPTPAGPTPGIEECRAMWDEKNMQPHIRDHCRMVANIAMWIGKRIKNAGVELDLDGLLAAALLHDSAKPYTVKHGGNHAQLGAAWVQQRVKNPRIAQCVLFHVHWPWELNARKWPGPLIVQYADKRVMHDAFVTIEERFADLMERYGTTERGRWFIERSHREAELLERHFPSDLGIDIYANPFDSGRLVD